MHLYTHTHTRIYACICTRMHRLKTLVTTPQGVKQYHRRTHASVYMCMHIYKCINIHICAQPAASVFAEVYVGVKTHLCSVHTCPCTMSRTPVPKCMQHSQQKNAHIYIPTPICIRIHMYTDTHAHALHRPHAEALILRPTIYAQICIHIHIHTCINAYIYMYIHTCTYIYIYMSAHIHTYTSHTHTHTNCIYARTQARLKRRRGSDCAGSPT